LENDEFRAITKSEWKRDNSVMMSSVKYSWDRRQFSLLTGQPVELPRVAAADRKGPGPPRPLRVKRVGFVMSAVCPV
jgi:hypothetical protein